MLNNQMVVFFLNKNNSIHPHPGCRTRASTVAPTVGTSASPEPSRTTSSAVSLRLAQGIMVHPTS
jgi:hypothetical protein